MTWHHSRRGRFKGTSLFYKPVTARDLRRSYLQAEDEEIAAADAEYYKGLALCRATGWHRVALNPLAVEVKREKSAARSRPGRRKAAKSVART